MKTIILEGIATSGKSTIINKLESAFPESQKVKVVPESETIMAIVDNTDKGAALSHLKSVIEDAYKTPSDVVVFDRLYLTHVFRVGGTMEDFASIEDLLAPHEPITIYLEVDEDAIAERVELASGHRDPSWKDYIQTKGQTFPEIADYYIKQQRNQKQLLNDSKIPYRICNTTSHDYEAVVREILAEV